MEPSYVTLKIIEFDGAFSRRLRIGVTDGVLFRGASLIAHSGDSWLWMLGLAILYASGNAYWQYRALIMAAGITVTAVAVQCLKYAVKRRRPEGSWGKIYRLSDPHSFPSGHAARGLVLAMIAIGLGPLWLGVLLLAWTPVVGIVRVMLGVHYLLDIFAGFAVGALTGLLVLAVV